MRMLVRIVRYLSEDGADAPKHHGWTHPLVVCFLYYAIVIPTIVWMHDTLVDAYGVAVESAVCRPTQRSIVRWLQLYPIWLLLWRIYTLPQQQFANTMFYEYCWLCTLSLHGGWIGLVLQRPILGAAFCIAIGIDQLLWYVDICYYLIFRKYLIGVCKYLFWKGTNWPSRITCTHHLWTLPLLLWTSGGVHPIALPLSFGIMTVNVVLSRWMIPSEVRVRGDTKYLNVNLGHAVWKDVDISQLQINRDNPPVHVYLFRLLWRWQALNTVVYIGLGAICSYGFGLEKPYVC